MKIAIALCLCLIPLCTANILDSFLDRGEISHLVDSLVEKFGTDATRQDCETECMALFTNDIIRLSCPWDCNQIQHLIKTLHSKTTAAPATV